MLAQADDLDACRRLAGDHLLEQRVRGWATGAPFGREELHEDRDRIGGDGPVPRHLPASRHAERADEEKRKKARRVPQRGDATSAEQADEFGHKAPSSL